MRDSEIIVLTKSHLIEGSILKEGTPIKILREFSGAEFYTKGNNLMVDFRRHRMPYQDFCKLAKKDIEAMKIMTALFKKAKVKGLKDCKDLYKFIKDTFGSQNEIYDVVVKNNGSVTFDVSELGE